jgi:hypothetical protein
MQDPNPLPWGALDRFQAHFIVRRQDDFSNDRDFLTKTTLHTKGYFGSKEITSVSWNGSGKLANILNQDSTLNEQIAKQSIPDATIYIEPTSTGIRIRSKWKNHLDFKVTKEMFEIYDKIASHIKSL